MRWWKRSEETVTAEGVRLKGAAVRLDHGRSDFTARSAVGLSAHSSLVGQWARRSHEASSPLVSATASELVS